MDGVRGVGEAAGEGGEGERVCGVQTEVRKAEGEAGGEIEVYSDPHTRDAQHRHKVPGVTRSSIVSNATVLQQNRVWSEEVVNELTVTSTALAEMLNNTLDIAKLEAGKLEFNRSFEPMYKLVDMVLGICKSAAAKKQITLQPSYAAALPPLVEIDQTRLSQVVLNLVSNAIKFTEAQGVVAVRIKWRFSCGHSDGNCESCPASKSASHDNPPFTPVPEEKNDPISKELGEFSILKHMQPAQAIDPLPVKNPKDFEDQKDQKDQKDHKDHKDDKDRNELNEAKEERDAKDGNDEKDGKNKEVVKEARLRKKSVARTNVNCRGRDRRGASTRHKSWAHSRRLQR
jgi:hypothetical protein